MNERFLFIDTETTGFKKSGPLIQDGQARVCQIAMLLTDDEGNSLAKMSCLIKPDGWVIGDGAYKVHGISMSHCEYIGFPMNDIFQIYESLTNCATKIIAHNADFDKGMMEIEEEYTLGGEYRNKIDKPWHCTMKTNTHISGGKWPKLAEAVRHYLNREPTAAHDAMGDCIDCRDVFFATYRK